MFNFLPRNTKFFDYFDRDTEVLVRTAECFRQFLESSGDAKEYSSRLKELEHEADRVTHEAMELLHRSFITPLERGDLRRLILALDEIVDYLDDAARRIALYDVGTILPEVCAMGKVIVDLARAVQAGGPRPPQSPQEEPRAGTLHRNPAVGEPRRPPAPHRLGLDLQDRHGAAAGA